MEHSKKWESNDYTLWRLLRRAWTILFREPWGKGRISRGEFCVTWLLSLALLSFASILLVFVKIFVGFWLLRDIVIFAFLIWCFWFWMRRTHDLWKPKKYFLMPVFWILWVWVLWFLLSIVYWLAGLITDGGNLASMLSPFKLIITWILALGTLWLLIWFVIILYRLLFNKWTEWDNEFGKDSLKNQPTENRIYRWAWVLLFVVSLVFYLLPILFFVFRYQFFWA